MEFLVLPPFSPSMKLTRQLFLRVFITSRDVPDNIGTADDDLQQKSLEDDLCRVDRRVTDYPIGRGSGLSRVTTSILSGILD